MTLHLFTKKIKKIKYIVSKKNILHDHSQLNPVQRKNYLDLAKWLQMK